MGHLAGKDLYRALGKKIDNMSMRAPWNNALYEILKELYSAQEAEFVIRMPYGLSTLDRLQQVTGYESENAIKLLESLCSKGLVMDIYIGDQYHYSPSPMVIGIFEFTMMRTGDTSMKKKAKLFHDYMEADSAFYRKNFGNGEQISVLRAVPHDETLAADFTEILEFESASKIISEHKRFAIGLCSCRHEKEHVGSRGCDIPLETCSSFGIAADFMIRRGFARESSKSEMLENLQRSRELGLVLSADNARKNVSFICHCCGCCCHGLRGIRQKGYANPVVTSGFVPVTDEEKCNSCGQCARDCPIEAIGMKTLNGMSIKSKKVPATNTSICLGCGVCTLRCKPNARALVRSGKRIIRPETTFERIILQSLERGTLQHQLFDDPRNITHKFLRALVGGFLRLPPVKKTLMSDTLRSRFLSALKHGAAGRGKAWTLEL